MSVNTQSVLVLQGIKNIIFDLGGVIINLSQEKTHQAFADLSGLDLSDLDRMVHTAAFFHDFEKGMLSDADFRNQLRATLHLNVDDATLDQAWNAMLLDIPLQRIRLLEELKNGFRLFLLSNTNNIHLECFNQQVFHLTGRPSLDEYFDKAYYSHLIRMRKPDKEIYEYVLHANGLHPSETIFLDDNRDNLAGANKVGIQTFHVQQPDLIFSLFR